MRGILSAIRGWLKQQSADWQAAWRKMQSERSRHKEQRMQITVPWTRWCDLLLAEERLRQEQDRAKTLAVSLAVERQNLFREQRLSETLGAILMAGEEPLVGWRDVTRLELAAPTRKGYDS